MRYILSINEEEEQGYLCQKEWVVPEEQVYIEHEQRKGRRERRRRHMSGGRSGGCCVSACSRKTDSKAIATRTITI